MKIAFVILHYNAIEETNKCIQYIKDNIDTEDYGIVVVDNASPDGSGKILMKSYEGDEKIKIVINNKNMGFARGNNVGFRVAKQEYCPKYIVMLNNDVFLIERELLKKLEDEYQKSKFYVAGPMILTGDGRCDVNPDRAVIKNKKDIDILLKKYKKIYKRYKFYYAGVYYKLTRIYDIILGLNNKKENKKYLDRQEDVKLHGCCLLFSENYIKEYDGLDESTFLYWEEEFLYKHMIDDKKKTVYNPNIIVYHQEDASTDSVVMNNRKKQMFIYKHYIQSLEMLKKLYME